MCGIVGYVGFRAARPPLLAGLEKLEYRGYDSAGTGIGPTRWAAHGRVIAREHGLDVDQPRDLAKTVTVA